MNSAVRHILHSTVDKFGLDLVRSPRLCDAFLSDLMPNYPDERLLLVKGVAEGVPSKLLQDNSPDAQRIIVDSFARASGLDPVLAKEVVTCWHFAVKAEFERHHQVRDRGVLRHYLSGGITVLIVLAVGSAIAVYTVPDNAKKDRFDTTVFDSEFVERKKFRADIEFYQAIDSKLQSMDWKSSNRQQTETKSQGFATLDVEKLTASVEDKLTRQLVMPEWRVAQESVEEMTVLWKEYVATQQKKTRHERWQRAYQASLLHADNEDSLWHLWREQVPASKRDRPVEISDALPAQDDETEVVVPSKLGVSSGEKKTEDVQSQAQEISLNLPQSDQGVQLKQQQQADREAQLKQQQIEHENRIKQQQQADREARLKQQRLAALKKQQLAQKKQQQRERQQALAAQQKQAQQRQAQKQRAAELARQAALKKLQQSQILIKQLVSASTEFGTSFTQLHKSRGDLAVLLNLSKLTKEDFYLPRQQQVKAMIASLEQKQQSLSRRYMQFLQQLCRLPQQNVFAAMQQFSNGNAKQGLAATAKSMLNQHIRQCPRVLQANNDVVSRDLSLAYGRMIKQ